MYKQICCCLFKCCPKNLSDLFAHKAMCDENSDLGTLLPCHREAVWPWACHTPLRSCETERMLSVRMKWDGTWSQRRMSTSKCSFWNKRLSGILNLNNLSKVSSYWYVTLYERALPGHHTDVMPSGGTCRDMACLSHCKQVLVPSQRTGGHEDAGSLSGLPDQRTSLPLWSHALKISPLLLQRDRKMELSISALFSEAPAWPGARCKHT